MRRTRNAGHTVLEAVVVTGLFAVVAGGAMTVIKDSSSVFKQNLRSDTATRTTAHASGWLEDELGTADPATLSIDTQSNDDGDILSFRVPLSIANAAVTWGTRSLVDGAWVEDVGATIRYSVSRIYRTCNVEVDGGSPSVAYGGGTLRLVRNVYDSQGNPLEAEQVLADNLDDVSERSGKAFTASVSGNFITIKVRLRISADANRGDSGSDLIQERPATIRLRNS